MKIAFLTSSRADFGIYLPLLKAITNDGYFDARLIVFGTHLSALHGNTIKNIQKELYSEFLIRLKMIEEHLEKKSIHFHLRLLKPKMYPLGFLR